MKFGPITIARNAKTTSTSVTVPERTAAAPPDYREYGAPGTAIFGGWMQQQDYNADLQAPACYDVYDRMRLGDGQVRSAMAVTKLPILRAFWQIVPASDSAMDHMIAEFIEADLEAMSISFISFMRQAMLMLDYGSMPFEKCWYGGDDGYVHLRKLAPRLPRTVIRWMADENGGFAGIEQAAIKSSGYEVVSIDAEKLLLFVNDQEGSNFRGTSMLRAAYKHWYFKDGLYRVDAIAKEKRSVGVDVGTIKPGAANKAELKASLERSMMTLHAHEKQFFIEDEENYSYRLETGSARIADALSSIEHHDLRILRAILAEFLAMGAGSTGSLAMHKDKSSFFLMTLEAIADNIAGVMNSHLIKQWVDYNWRVTAYPKFKYSRLDTRDTALLADAVAKLVTAGAMTMDADTENEIRVVMDLPERPDTPLTDPNEPPQTDPGTGGVKNAVRKVQERQVARLLAEAPSLFRAENPKPIDAIDVPFRTEMAAKLAENMAGKPQLVAIRAKAAANQMADRLKLAFVAEMIAQVEAGAYDADALTASLAGLTVELPAAA